MPEKHLCFITPGHICSNPRLVKEASAAREAGYRVTVIAAQYLSALKSFDEAIVRQNPGWEAVFIAYAGDTFREKWIRFTSGLIQRLGKYLNPDWQRNRIFFQQLRAARKVRADLYIAHNTGALPVAAKAAALRGRPYAFDAEDYHRAEQPEGHPYNTLQARIEDRYIPGAAYTSAASPLIAEACQKLFPHHSWTPILNVFSLRQQPEFWEEHSGPLRLFWFSQVVGKDRGLEELLAAMQMLLDIPIELTLLGMCSEADKAYFSAQVHHSTHRLSFQSTVPEDELIRLSARHHLGLALERRTPPNRNICLTNKVFTYLLAGNAVIASGTDAQRQFMEQYPGIGQVYPIGDAEALAGIIRNYHEHRKGLEATRRRAWELAREELNWEQEQIKFLSLVEEVCSKIDKMKK